MLLAATAGKLRASFFKPNLRNKKRLGLIRLSMVGLIAGLSWQIKLASISPQ
jgi:hypothetical protein